MVLDGIAIANTIGILFNSGGSLTVRDSVIRNFTNDGIHFAPNASTRASFLCRIRWFQIMVNDGIEIGSTGTGTVTGVLDHVAMENNGVNGLTLVPILPDHQRHRHRQRDRGQRNDGIYRQSSSGATSKRHGAELHNRQ